MCVARRQHDRRKSRDTSVFVVSQTIRLFVPSRFKCCGLNNAWIVHITETPIGDGAAKATHSVQYASPYVIICLVFPRRAAEHESLRCLVSLSCAYSREFGTKLDRNSMTWSYIYTLELAFQPVMSLCGVDAFSHAM